MFNYFTGPPHTIQFDAPETSLAQSDRLADVISNDKTTSTPEKSSPAAQSTPGAAAQNSRPTTSKTVHSTPGDVISLIE